MPRDAAPSPAAGHDETARPRWRPLVMAGIATLISLAILVALGTWQMQRLAWKEDLIARIEARAYGAPVAIPPEGAWASFDPAQAEYTRVRLEGTFEHAAETRVHGLLGTATRGQPLQGYYLLTPLRLPDGSTVIVNRGFAPTEEVEEAARPEGPVSVEGLIRASEERTAFVPENDPRAGTWFTRDVAEIADARGLERVAPFLVDEAAPDEAMEGAPRWPQAGATVLQPPNNHLSYALTWYGLAVTLAVIFVAFSRRWLSGREL